MTDRNGAINQNKWIYLLKDRGEVSGPYDRYGVRSAGVDTPASASASPVTPIPVPCYTLPCRSAHTYIPHPFEPVIPFVKEPSTISLIQPCDGSKRCVPPQSASQCYQLLPPLLPLVQTLLI